MVASRVYFGLSEATTEPVLATITRLLGSDEARHAGSFFRYARRLLARSERPTKDRRDLVMLLRMWLGAPGQLHHPTTLSADEYAGHPEIAAAEAELRQRVTRVFGQLVGDPTLREPGDVRRAFQALRAGRGDGDVN